MTTPMRLAMLWANDRASRPTEVDNETAGDAVVFVVLLRYMNGMGAEVTFCDHGKTVSLMTADGSCSNHKADEVLDALIEAAERVAGCAEMARIDACG